MTAENAISNLKQTTAIPAARKMSSGDPSRQCSRCELSFISHSQGYWVHFSQVVNLVVGVFGNLLTLLAIPYAKHHRR